MRIKLNGQPIETLTVIAPEPREYAAKIPAAVLRENNVLTFELPDAESPLALGVGGDARLLGINVQWLKLD